MPVLSFVRLASTCLLLLTAAMPAAWAQGSKPLDTPKLPTGSAAKAAPPKPGSPVVEGIVAERRPPLEVRKRPRLHVAVRRHRHHPYAGRFLARPALAGVELVAPLSPPGEPPHVTVPVPAYPLESLAAAITTPPPPIVCHPTRRDPTLPDPHLYKEGAVVCEPDNP